MSICLSGALRLTARLPGLGQNRIGNSLLSIEDGFKFAPPSSLLSLPRCRPARHRSYGAISAKEDSKSNCVDGRYSSREAYNHRSSRWCASLFERQKIWYQLSRRASNLRRYVVPCASPQARHPLSDPRFPGWLFSKSRRAWAHNLRKDALVQKFRMFDQKFHRKKWVPTNAWSNSRVPPDRLFIRSPVIYHAENPTRTSSFKEFKASYRYEWFRNFNLIAAKHCNTGILQGRTISVVSRHRIERYIEKCPKIPSSSYLNPAGRLAKRWQKLGLRRQRKKWMTIVLSALHADPKFALAFLSPILQSSRSILPQYASADCIALICHTLLEAERGSYLSKNTKYEAKACVDLAIKLLECYPGLGYDSFFTPYIFDLLIANSDGEQLHAWAKTVPCSPGPRIAEFIQKLALRATEIGEASIALDLQRAMPKDEFISNKITAACTAILLATIPSQDAYNQRVQMLTLMLEQGVRPDERLRDAILRLAMVGRDLDLAWQTHQRALENGVLPTVRTYIYLLDGIEEMQNVNVVLDIVRQTEKAGLLQRSTGLANAIIRALYRMLMTTSDQHRYDVLLDIYAKVFDLRPLSDVGLLKISQITRPRTLLPSRDVLQKMLSAWISECCDLGQLTTLYERWIELVKAGTSRIAITAQTSDVFRAFMVQFNTIGSKHMSFQALQAFLQDLPKQYTSLNRSIATRLRDASQMPCGDQRSNVQSYSALIHSFATNGEMREAEEVVQVMQRQGVEPDAILYEILLLGYAKSQDIPNAVRMLTEKRSAGYATDEWTMRAMGKIVDRESLRRALLATECRSTQSTKRIRLPQA